MLRFLKEAFFFRVPTRILGAVPANLLFVGAMAVFGFGHPGFWFLGAGIELTYLLVVAGNPRFQRLVLMELKERQRESHLERLTRVLTGFSQFVREQSAPATRVVPNAAQIPQLRADTAGAAALDPGQARYNTLADRVTQIVERYRTDHVDDQLARSNQESLHALLLVYAELLYTRAKLASLEAAPGKLEAESERLRAELARGGLSREIAESKQATLETLQKRLAGRQRRILTDAQIASDLERVEQQVELAREAALGGGDVGRINADLNIASMFLGEDTDFGSFAPEPIAPATPDREEPKIPPRPLTTE